MMNFDICKKNWKKMLVGSAEDINVGDEFIQSCIAACNSGAMEAWKLYQEAQGTRDAVGLFRTIPAEQSSDMTDEYRSLRNMALGYATYGTECYQNESLLGDILHALEWGYEHYYGVAEMEDRGWRSTKIYNWHDWKIGTPMHLMDTMILVEEHLSLRQKRNYLALFDKLVQHPFDYGANKVDFGRLIVQSGILCENVDRILVGRDGIEDTYLYADGGVNDGQGFYRDGSYIFHTAHPMNFAYGLGHFSSLINLASVIANSDFQLKDEHSELLHTWLYRHFVPFCRNGEVFRSVTGRENHRALAGVFSLMKCIVRLYAISDERKREDLSDLLTMLFDEHPLREQNKCTELFKAFGLNDYIIFKQAYKPSGSSFRRSGLFAFNCMDRAVHHQDQYSFALSLSSSRIYNYECINHNNMEGWYLGDGMLCLVSSLLQYGSDYWKTVDPYRLPGTTVDDRKRDAVSIAQANEYLSSKSFVGTLTTGDTGVSVMELESYHGDGALVSDRFYSPDGAYGSAAPMRSCSLCANKAYFFMKGYVVCLGSAVDAHDDATVYTVVENRHEDPKIANGRVVGYAPLQVTVNGKDVDLTNVDTVFHDVKYMTLGSDAYCILDGQPLVAKRTDTLPSFVQFVLDHGKNPKDGSYAYAVLPMTNAEAAKQFSENPPFEILHNSRAVQMLREKGSGDLYCVFHESGEFEGISTKYPIMCAIKQGILYACDVTQTLQNVTLEINGKQYEFDFTDSLGQVQSRPLVSAKLET